MTAATLERRSRGEDPASAATVEARREPSGLTLEDLILGAWGDLDARGRVDCPVCRRASGLTERGCVRCGSALS